MVALVKEGVHRGERHGGIEDHLVPLAEGLIGGDQHGAPLVRAPIDSNRTPASAWSLRSWQGREDQEVEPVEQLKRANSHDVIQPRSSSRHLQPR